MITKIALTALIVYGISRFGAELTYKEHKLCPDNTLNGIIHYSLKSIAVISILTIVGCLIACVWTAKLD